MNFFSSDLHFGNDAALLVDNRPFKNSKQFERYVVRIWNKQANKNDTIWVVGDFVDYHPNQNCDYERGLRIVKKIKANVRLIMGNNEKRLVKELFNGDFEKFREYCLNLGFVNVEENCTLELYNQKFFLTHKPIDHRDDMLNLFGHSHRSMGVYKSFGFNIGCDLNHFRLFSEEDIKKLIKYKKEYWDKDENLKLV